LEEPQGRKHAYTNSHDAPFFMFIPMFILSFGSIFIGYIGRDLFIGLGSFFWQNAIFVLPVHEKLLLSEFGVPFSVKLIPVIFSLMGACLGFVLYMYFKEYTFNLKSGSFKGL
jgi:NADH-ubiquinone oxidoreductase chain 5